jgi:hypothetical protein
MTAALAIAACGSSDDSPAATITENIEPSSAPEAEGADETTSASDTEPGESAEADVPAESDEVSAESSRGATSAFEIDVWADNWMAVYVDGELIAQVTDLTTGEVVAGTDSTWAALVVHQAPLNAECVSDADPDRTCEFLIIDTPADWTSAAFDDSSWATATEWSAADVSPKDGYDQISWDASAQLIWGTDLEVDNTVLLRTSVS